MSTAVDVLKQVTEPSLVTENKKRQNEDEHDNIQNESNDNEKDTKKIKVETKLSLAIDDNSNKEENKIVENTESEDNNKENIKTMSDDKQNALHPPDISTKTISTFREVCDKWSHEVEAAFIGALRLILKNGTYKIKLLDKNYGRNELISIYIQYKTKEVRTKKQISSHIQVWKKAILNKMTNGVPLSELEKEVLRLIEHGVQQNEHTVKLFYSIFEEIIDPMSYRNDNIKVSKSQSNLSLSNGHLSQNMQGHSNLASNNGVIIPPQYTQLQQQPNGYVYPRSQSISTITDSNGQYRSLQAAHMYNGSNVSLQHQQNTNYPHINKLRVLSESNIYMTNQIHDNNSNKNSIIINSQNHQPHSHYDFTNSYTTSTVSADIHRNNSIASQPEEGISADKNKIQNTKYHSYNAGMVPAQVTSNAYNNQYSSLKLPPMTTVPTYDASNYKKYQYSSGDSSQRSSLGQIHGNVSSTTTATPNQVSGMRAGSVSNTSPHQQHIFNNNGLLSYQQSNITQEKPVIPSYSTKSRYISDAGTTKVQHPMPISEHSVPALAATNSPANLSLPVVVASQQHLTMQQRGSISTPLRTQPFYLQMQKLPNAVNQPSQMDSQLPNDYIHYK